jgi:hypothetical protein
MLSFAITLSPDETALGEVKLGGNEISLGSTDAQIMIEDPQLIAKHIVLRVGSDGHCYAEVAKDKVVAVNRKKKAGTVRLNKNDTLQFGKTTLFVEDFEYTDKVKTWIERKNVDPTAIKERDKLLERLEKIDPSGGELETSEE